MTEVEKAILTARAFVDQLAKTPTPTGKHLARPGQRGLQAPGFPLSATARVAWASLVCSQVGSNKHYLPIDPQRHTVSVGSNYEKSRHTYTFEERPDIVFSNAQQLGIDALRATLKAEAWMRELAVELDEKPERTADEDVLFRMASAFANQLARFHLTGWSIREPASLDSEQRELQARAVVKRAVVAPLGYRQQSLRAAND